MKKRLLSIVLAMCMALSILPTATRADNADSVANPAPQSESDWVAYAVEGGNIYFDPTTGEISDCDANVTSADIPAIIEDSPVTSIGEWAFCGCSLLTSVTIPVGVTSIGRNAFSDCKSLASINSPDSIVSIGAGAFSNCGITSFVIPNGVTEIELSTFQWCINLANIVIPDGVTSIEGHAFQFCASLTSVDIPESVTSIGEGAFNNSGLVCINIPAGVTINDKIPFYNCTNLLEINVQAGSLSYTSVDGVLFSADMKTMIRYPGGKSATSYTVPDGVTDISTAFRYCSSLTSINVPVSVTDTGNWSFGGCDNLKDIYYGGSKEQWLDFGGRRDLLTGWVITIHFADDAYTITYTPNGGTGTMADTLLGVSEVYILPACTFTAPTGKKFKAWQINGEEYAPGSTYTITADTTVTAVWQTVSTAEYTLTGTITGHKGVTYTSVTAQLVGQDGSTYSAEVADGVVDKTGKTEYAYTVSAPAGQYNLNVTATTAAGSVVNRTVAVNLTRDGQTQNINLPNGQANSNSSGGGNSSNSNYKISIPTNINGGTVTISPTNARAGATVTITASPDKGYELESISVKDSKGNSIAVTEVGNGKYTFTMPSSSVSVSAAFVAAAPTPVTTFIDVEPSAYYADAVAWAVENGITSGTGDGRFSPNEPCTRSQIVTFLWRAAGCPEVDITTAFTDVAPGSYYEMAVAWAVANGITNGAGGGKFSPNEPCTRAQAVAFLYRAKGSPSADEGNFSDVGSGLWYTDAVSWAVANGITNGTGDGRFSPDDICTRGQIVTFLYRDRA